jgi:hypothetical protein
MVINERIHTVYDKNGKEQFFIKNDADQSSNVFNYEDVNYKKKFEELVKFKGNSCLWAYNHNIGFNPRQLSIKDNDGNIIGYETKEESGLKARARYLGQESWYDEEHFFWVKFPGDDKPLLTQLRVSNHETKHSQWQKSHSEKRVVSCDTCLNIIIDETNRDTFNSDATTPFIITSIEVKYPLKNVFNDLINPNTPANIFIKQIQNDLKPVVTLQDINKIFNTVAIIKRSGYGSIRPNQYMGNNPKAGTAIPQSKLGIIERSYIPELIDDTVENWEEILQQKKEEEERKKREEIMKNTIPTVIPDDAIFNSSRTYVNPVDKKELESFEYNGRWYALESDEEKFNFYIQNDKNVAKYTTCSYIAYLITNDGYIRKKPVIPIAEEWEIKQIEETEFKRKKLKEDINMKILVKTNKGLRPLGEGRIYSKSQLKLNEVYTDGKVSLTLNPNGQDVRASSVQTNAQNMLHTVPQATAVTLQADDVDGVTAPNYSSTDPRNDTVQQVPVNKANSTAIQNAAKNGGTIQITKNDPQQTAMESKDNKKDIVEMRNNSIPFTKKELNDFLSSL